MRTFRDAKAMAKALRFGLSRRGLSEPTHGQSLEIVAEQFGLGDWNILAARLKEAEDRAGGVGLNPAIPVLRIFSIEKAREFYLDYLGFELSWEHRFEPQAPLYMQIERGGTVLHLSEHHGDGSPGAVVFVPMTGIDALHAELSAKDYPYLNPGIEDVPWESRCMTLTDPFGNSLRFNEYRRR
ncbi:glyoxalase superfamily protein [Glycomyces salinus]|uniref:glyoxalase superfamily protein n=1 Tax=Glycomyces salinus TaxID=980294 RepID=UPI0018EE1A95|nr:glyoxalase superfamily protein [Glycomyces salinus]